MYVTGLVFLLSGGAGSFVTMRRREDKKASVFFLVVVLGLVMIGFASISMLVNRA